MADPAPPQSTSDDLTPPMPAQELATLDELVLDDDPVAWSKLGFVVEDDRCAIGAAELRFAPQRESERDPDKQGKSSILSWSLHDLRSTDLDGLPTTISDRPRKLPMPAHPNGVRAIDHIVAISPDLNRTVATLQAAGLDLRRVRNEPTPAGAPRQAFFRLGREILEVVQEPDDVIARAGGTARPIHFWGLALLVDDLDRSAQMFAPHVSDVRPAIQPGRRIATLRRTAGLAIPLALISAKDREGADE